VFSCARGVTGELGGDRPQAMGQACGFNGPFGKHVKACAGCGNSVGHVQPCTSMLLMSFDVHSGSWAEMGVDRTRSQIIGAR
jgi:hypothetical protein